MPLFPLLDPGAGLTVPAAACGALGVGIALDCLLGEPRRWHPLIGFGHASNAIERRLNRDHHPARARRLLGVGAWLLVVVLPVAAFLALRQLLGPLGWLLDGLALWFALGARSLREHVTAVANPLLAGDLPGARLAVGRIVSRDTSALDSAGVAGAAIESTLENGADAITNTLFWFAVAGGGGALLHRLANTLDAMWGYRTPRFQAFGWAAARADDLLAWLPSRLTAASYALATGSARAARSAWQCWRRQAPAWESPNAGPVMAAGAGALQIRLGGPAVYHGRVEQRPPLGCGDAPDAAGIRRALRLVALVYAAWVAALALGCAV